MNKNLTFKLIDNGFYEIIDEKNGNKKIDQIQLAEIIKSGEFEKILRINNHDENIIFNLENSYEKAKSDPDNMQNIYFGVPGTGKSHLITKKIQEIYSSYDGKKNLDNRIFRITIHSDFSYYDFVGSIMPKSSSEKISYEFTAGIFTKALKRSLEIKEPVFLILEEMNRGNISSIFGDLFQLLDRDSEGTSEYSINNDLITNFIGKKSNVLLPKNLHILGTMNTSDQNIFAMDNAFKRRFSMEYIPIKVHKDKNESFLNNYTMEKLGFIKNWQWVDFFPIVNKFIIDKMELSEDKQMGHFFLKFSNEEKNKKQIFGKLFLYLWADIEKSSFNDNKIFDKNIKSFSDLVLKAEKENEIFSNEFKKFYNEKKHEQNLYL